MSQSQFTVLDNEWITVRDGTQLAARIWMPRQAASQPVPSVLEFLPYRKRNGTAPRDESTYPAFAAAGIAGVRVDIRGSGESEGVIDGEYTPRELSDACEVIEWIARQPWSNGNVGMMGISWGGFNCLQVAALKPTALKAVISIASTTDRYNDDIHYKNGTHLSAQLSWAATMQAYQSRAPDPAIVGDRWREMWLQRLEDEPFFMEEWLRHQRRDGFWEHGSICENFEEFSVPALVIAGWADGYRNTPLKAVEGMPRMARALIGPWVHKYPHFAYPKPRADFLGEAIAWWNCWLRDEKNGADAIPQVRAYILDGPKPALWRDRDPGFWVAKKEWSKPATLDLAIARDMQLTPNVEQKAEGKTILRSPLDTGTASGEWFTLKPDSELPGDQRPDDAGSVIFDSAPIDGDVLVLGQPVVNVRVTSDAPLANLCVRIVDVHPDGTATRVTFGVLNLAHRDGNAEPLPLVPGQPVDLALTLDACGYRFAPGHRIRLALSTAYWPMILPPPVDVSLELDLASVELGLPLLGEHDRISVPEPANPDPLPRYEIQEKGGSQRIVERDLVAGRTHYRVFEDTGLNCHPENGLASREICEEIWSIDTDDPLSVTGSSRWTCIAERQGWRTTTHVTSTLSCTETEWIIAALVEAIDDGATIFSRRKETRIRRDLM